MNMKGGKEGQSKTHQATGVFLFDKTAKLSYSEGTTALRLTTEELGGKNRLSTGSHKQYDTQKEEISIQSRK